MQSFRLLTNKFTPSLYQYRLIANVVCLFMLFLAGCKKEEVVIPETKIDQLRSQVSNWYNSVKNGGTINPGSITQEIKSNSLSQQSINEYAFLQVDSLNFNRAYINFDSSKFTGLSVPIKTNINTGEYIQLSTLSYGNKTKGYFVRSIPDANWYKVLGIKSDFTKMSGRIFVYNIKGKLISNAILVDGIVSNNSSTNQSKTNGNQLGAIKSNSWGYDENGLFSVTVYGYRRHTSWSDLIALAIFDSGNDLGIPLGGDYTPFVPFDPIYGAPSGGGAISPIMPSALESALFHKFPMNSNYQTLYPKFYSLVKNLYNTAIKDRKTLDALKTYGHFTSDEKLFEILQFGNGAEIEIKDINTGYNGQFRYGYFNPKNPNKIEIEISTIREFELGSSDISTGLNFFLFVTLMHETVHYANHLNGFYDKKYEWGFGWETSVYGRHVGSPSEAWDYF